MALNEKGHEVVSDKPVAMPVGVKREPTLNERIAAMVRNELSARAAAEGNETFEEADDFDVGDDLDPSSPYEENFDQIARLEEDKKALREVETRSKTMHEEEPVDQKLNKAVKEVTKPSKKVKKRDVKDEETDSEDQDD